MSTAADLAQAATTGHPNTKKPRKPKKKLQNVGSCTGMTKIDYCTEYASIKCSQSSHFLKLQVLPMMNRPKFGPFNHHGATVTDCIPEVNYPVFTAPWNLCFSLLNPQVLAATTAKFAATGTWSTVPMPCCLAHLPIGVWGKSVGEMKLKYIPHTGGLSFLSFRNLALFFRSNPETDCLTKNCTLTCAWLGTITIASSGRDEANPVPYNPVDGLIGPSVFDCLRNACGMLMNYTGLGGMAALAALDSVFAGLQKGFETGDPMEGLFAGLKTAAGYAIGLGIAAGAGKAGGAFLTRTKIGKNLASKVSAKFSAFAQSNFTRGLSKLHVNAHTLAIVSGNLLKGNSRTKTAGKLLEWMGRRNLYNVLEGRAKLLGDIRIKLNNERLPATERLTRLEQLDAQQAVDKRWLSHLDSVDRKATTDMTPMYWNRQKLSEQRQRLVEENAADINRRDDLNRKIDDIIDQEKDIYKTRDRLNENDHGGVMKDMDTELGRLNNKMDNMAVESAVLDAKINSRNEQITRIDDDINSLNRGIGEQGQRKQDVQELKTEIKGDMAKRNEEIDSYVGKDLGNDYNTKVITDNKIEKIDNELAHNSNRASEVDLTKPDTKADKALDWFHGKGPEGPEPTTKWGKFKKGAVDATNAGNTANAKGAVNWTTDNIANTTYQGEIDSIGSGEPDPISYDYSEINGDSIICDDNPSGLHQD